MSRQNEVQLSTEDKTKLIMSCPYLANYIVKFKKDASAEDVEKFYDEISKQGQCPQTVRH